MGKNMLGRQTYSFKSRPMVRGAFSVVGVKENQGPMKEWFDMALTEDTFGEKTWEKSESKMLKTAMEKAVESAGSGMNEVDLIFSGDLLNQLMSSAFMARDEHRPFLGLYGACSTMAQSMLMAAAFVDGGFADNVAAGASSHYCTAERQFRMPLEHGNQRPVSAQWTATAAGAVLISSGEAAKGSGNIRITCATAGKILDPGVKDANQMGAAMAPAAVDTILTHLEDTGREIDYYDKIFTGDLGFIGREIACDLLTDAGLDKEKLLKRYEDCGCMMYYKSQDVHGGGSGCGCSASMYAGYVFKEMKAGNMKRVLLLSTGALLSTISPFQGESIPGIAHAVALELD